MRSLMLLVGLTITFLLPAHAQTPPPLLARPPEPVTHTVTLTGEERWKIAVSHPKPQYPAEARRRRITGNGLFHLHVSYATGDVTSVGILTSTGHRILDDAAVESLKRWKFRPHSVIGMKVPITFSISSKT
jgi:periplasmic protein TonB